MPEPFGDEPAAVAVAVAEEAPSSAEESTVSSNTEHITLTWKNLSFVVKDGKEKKTVLHNLTGAAKPGDLVAVLGPSGAGKSTLLNVLASRAPYGKRSGEMSMNGQSPKKFRKKIAYVMQEDALLPTLTPRETFAFTAALKRPDLTAEEQAELVESVLSTLGLQRCADTMVGNIMIKGISGGEKKRTSVGVELVSSPSVIFLDEPTSGLDSYNAFEVINHLRGLAKAGSTIMCSIHQPSSEVFDLFNKVMLLRDGHMIYDGPTEGIPAHFAKAGVECEANFNPADFAMHQVQVLPEEKLKLLMAEDKEAHEEAVEEHDEEITSVEKAPFAYQVYHLTKREVRQFLRDTATLGARYGLAVILAILTGLFFFSTGDEWGDDGDSDDINSSINNHWAAVVFASIIAMFISAQPMLLVFPSERSVFMRENATGTYATFPYFLSKTIVELPSAILQTLLVFVISYFMVDLQGNFFYIVVSTTLLGLTTSSIALCLGAATTRADTAVNIMPAIYVPQILACGFFISSEAMPPGVRWTQWICPLKYGLALTSLGELSSKYVPANREAEVRDLLNASEIHPDDWYLYAIILCAMYVFFRVLAAYILFRRAKNFG